MTVLADPAELTTFGSDVLEALGVPEPDARLVSDSLVTADLWGHPSHGMLRLPWYAARLALRRHEGPHRDRDRHRSRRHRA